MNFAKSLAKHYVVVGLGKTGFSCISALIKRGFKVSVTDSRKEPPCLLQLREQYPQVDTHLGDFNQELMLSADELVVSQGVPLAEPSIVNCAKQNIPIIGDIELFARAKNAKLIAITGSNGKTTVTSLMGLMAKKAGIDARVGGNIGTPALDLLTPPPPQLYILEVSNFQLATTHSLQADVATVLNVSPDHMDHYQSFAQYVAVKQRIYRNAKFMVYNRDDPNSKPINNPQESAMLNFGLSSPFAEQFGIITRFGEHFLAQGTTTLLNTKQLNIVGKHNWANALAALALGQAMHFPLDAMLLALQEFSGLSHRCQWVREIDGVNWYNDSKGTNVGATLAAISGLMSTLPGSIVWIAGGLAKGADFSPLRQVLPQAVSTMILYGQDAKIIAQNLGDLATTIQVKDLSQAILAAKTAAKAGDAVLLSPACASFDLFRDFVQRGEIFMQLVKELN